MGHFYYSSVKANLNPTRVEKDLIDLNAELWKNLYRVERISGVPVTSEDERWAKWCFTFEDPKYAGSDASFSICLLKDGRLEFKVPRTQWDENWDAQQKIRRHLVRQYNRCA